MPATRSNNTNHERRFAFARSLMQPAAAGRVLVCDTSSLAGAAAKFVIRAVESAIHERGHCSLALAGGTAWQPTYKEMRKAWLAERVDWGQVSIYFGDERCVPADDPRSNYRMATASLLSHAPISKATIHRILAEGPDPTQAALDYERILPPSLDVLLLGMGADGHTASLFPHSPALAETARRVVTGKGPAGLDRITITPPVIRAAGTTFVLASGVQKSAAIAGALEGPWLPEQLPIQLAHGATWLIDTRAARGLRGEYEQAG